MNNQKNNTQIAPAQLWIGSHSNLINQVKKSLQKKFCKNNACKKCKTCELIDKKQHHGAVWLKPEKLYTRNEIQVIFDTISFKLETNQKLFFIIQYADFLTASCANSLLKSVEEPPEGYHFIFLAERQSQILPTIQSRCIITPFYTQGQQQEQKQIAHIFTLNTICPPTTFLKILDEEKPHEKETIEILDTLLKHWLEQTKTALKNDNHEKYNTAHNKVAKIKRALQSPPMPGSSKIFWRNLYLQLS